MRDESPQGCLEEKKTLNCDQEAWLIDQIYLAVRMARGVLAEADVSSHEPALDYAIRGIVHGVAAEIAFGIFYVQPEYVNIQKRPSMHVKRIKERVTHIHIPGSPGGDTHG